MKEITIVATNHKSHGCCNVESLLQILEAIAPEVVFEEIRAQDFQGCYADRRWHTLEMQAIMKFKESRAIRQIPVDDFVMAPHFRPATESLFSYIKSISPEYAYLKDLEDQHTYFDGFKYLNSEDSERIDKRMYQISEKIVANTDKKDIKDIFNEWNRFTQSREHSMIKNIYAQSRQLNFTKGAFLVGAGHIFGIKERIKEMAKTESDLINWKIWKSE